MKNDSRLGIITDACPYGIGAILVASVGPDTDKLTVIAALQGEITMQEARLLNIPYGVSDSQGPA